MFGSRSVGEQPSDPRNDGKEFFIQRVDAITGAKQLLALFDPSKRTSTGVTHFFPAALLGCQLLMLMGDRSGGTSGPMGLSFLTVSSKRDEAYQ